MGSLRRHMRGVLADGRQHSRRVPEAVVLVLGGTADVARIQAREGKGGVLDMQSGRRRPAGRAANRRRGKLLDERAVRHIVLCAGLSAARLPRSVGQDDGQDDRKDMQIHGRHIVSALHGALSVHLSVLCVGEKRESDLRAIAARRSGADLFHRHCAVFSCIDPEAVLPQDLLRDLTVQLIVLHQQDVLVLEIRILFGQEFLLCIRLRWC